jgi:uncharacterized membrane protein
MQNFTMNRPQAELELILLQAEADATSNADVYIWLRESGLPSEAAIRLTSLMEVTKQVGERVINIGKIVVVKLVEFARKHPNLAVGVAVGVVISLLVSSVPFLGPLLAPIALILGVAVGAIVGHKMDKAQEINVDPNLGIAQEIIEIAREFFRLLIETLQISFSAETGNA